MVSSSPHRKFRSQRRRVLLLALVVVLLASPAQAKRGASRAVDITVDVLVLRPTTLGATVLGTLVYAALLPITWPIGKESDVREVLVVTPFEETFQRPLGDW